ncbi:MAG: C39 family peptidase [Ardenticatenaceae bacterium]|nr:C39 family peptidase [Ardenticatenaceae bacterium]
MSKQKLAVLFILFTLAGLLAFPTLLKAIPPRYAARLPEPLRQMSAPRDVVPLLPTVARPLAANELLQSTGNEGTTAVPVSAPPTLTPPLVTGQTPKPTSPPTPTKTPTVTPVPLPQSARLEGVHHQFQEWNNCGPATLAMTLSYFGLTLTQSQTAAVLKPNPEDRNVSPWEMAAYVNNETDLKAINRVNGDLYTVRRLLANDIPVILEIGIDPPGEFRWLGWYGHYLLVVAYDDALQQFWVYDSWFGTSEVPLENATSEGRVLTYDDVAEYWPHFNRNYIALYRPEQANLAAEIIGTEMDDAVMWQNALEEVRGETAVSPDNAFLWFNLGTIYNALGQYKEAATAYDQARSIGLPWRMLWYQFGPYEAYFQVGRYEDVLLLADTTLKDRPYFEESFYYKGLALAALGDTAAARDNLEKAAKFNPNFQPAATALAELVK